MQVTNHSVSRQINDSKNQINTGDVSPVLIKDKFSPNEAKVLFKGQEFSAKFEGGMPSSDRMLAEVVGMPEKGKLLLRDAFSNSNARATQSQTIDARLAKAGIDSISTDLKNAIKIFDNKGVTLTNDNLSSINKFVNEAPGTSSEKLETVNALAQKNLPVTEEHLNSIHKALHGPLLKDSLLELTGGREIKFENSSPSSITGGQTLKDIPLPKSIEQILQQIKNGEFSSQEIEEILSRLERNSNPEIKLLKQEIVKALQIHTAGNDRIQKATPQSIIDGEKLKNIATVKLRDSFERLASLLDKNVNQKFPENELIKLQYLLRHAQKDASITNLLDSVGKAIEEFADKGKWDLSHLIASFEKATQLADKGRELAARKALAEGVNQLEKDHPELKNSANQLTLTDAEQYAINESLQSLALQSKTLLVTEISKKLSQMAIDFKKVKQEITKSLDHISLMLDKEGSKVNAKQTLDTGINKLDNAILKSNFMLYTDMLTEKKMLTASSRLSEARNLLAKGEFSQASHIVKEVKATLDQIIYKPSNTRVQHFVSEQSLLKSAVSVDEQLAYGIKQAVKPMPNQEYSARQVFESLKRLGLTHENDAANSLVFGTKGDQEELNNNLKSKLIQMAQNGEGHSKAEQALANITGQQLLNKQDSSGMQNLFLQMPFLLNQKMENIKVFINSQKSGEKIDWENCSLYFVLETKKLGEVGIHVTAQNRSISITFNSKKDDLGHLLEPMTEISKERLQEIGYKLEALKAKMTSTVLKNESSVENISNLTPAFTEKGYDFTI